MTKQQFESLSIGDIVRHKNSMNSLLVSANYGGRVTLIQSDDMTNPDEWLLLFKATQKPEEAQGTIEGGNGVSSQKVDLSSSAPCQRETAIADALDSTGAEPKISELMGQAARALRRLIVLLSDANDICRQAFKIAERSGADTHWPAFKYNVESSLKRQHAQMHPKCCQCGKPLDIEELLFCNGCRTELCLARVESLKRQGYEEVYDSARILRKGDSVAIVSSEGTLSGKLTL